MPTLSRADNSVLGRWWWTVDRWTLGAIGTLIGFGYIMMLAASPAVAERIGSSRDLFILKQVFFLAAAGAIVVAVSLGSPRTIRRIALIGCLIARSIPPAIIGEILHHWPLFFAVVAAVIAASTTLGWLLTRWGEDGTLRELEEIFPRWYDRHITESSALGPALHVGEPVRTKSFEDTVRDYLGQELGNHADELRQAVLDKVEALMREVQA